MTSHDRHAAFTERIVALQSRINAKRGPGRAFHRKQVAAPVGDAHGGSGAA